MEREKHIISGPLLEVDFFPVTQDGRQLPQRAAKSKPSTKAQEKYNRNQAIKKAIRIINANFDNTDIFMHVTYDEDNAPQSKDEAKRDIVNYFRRVKRYRESKEKMIKKKLKSDPKNKMLKQILKKLKQPFRYYYRIESATYKTGLHAGRENWHFHIFMTGWGMDDRDKAESMWRKGTRVNANRFQPEKFGPDAAARYISKGTQGKKYFGYSRNLKKPRTPPPRDGKITRRGVERMAKERVDDAAYWERRYKGYRFRYCFPRLNPYNGHWYVSVVMYKAGAQAPPWSTFEE